MYFSDWININAGCPFENIYKSLNPNFDYRVNLVTSAKKITLKTWSYGGITDNFLEEESLITFNNESKLIESEILKSSYGNKPVFKAQFVYNNLNEITEIIRSENRNNVYYPLIPIILKQSKNSIIVESESFIKTHFYNDNKLIEFTSFYKPKNILSDQIKIYYNNKNRIFKIEEFSQEDDEDTTEEISKYYDEPKLLFISNFNYVNIDNGGIEIFSEVHNLIDNTEEKTIYIYDEYNNKISKTVLNNKNEKMTTFKYLFEYDEFENWIKLEIETTYHEANKSKITTKIEREITY